MKKRDWKERCKAAEGAAEWWRHWSEVCQQQRDVATREAERARVWAEKSEQEVDRLRALVIDGS